MLSFFFFQAEDGIRDSSVTGVQTCALPISKKVWWRLVKPTFSRSLCLPPARTHFCAVVARVYSRFSRPRKTSLNWFIPAFVNSRVASPCGTSDELRIRRCPLPSKKRKKASRISLPLQNLAFACAPLTGGCISLLVIFIACPSRARLPQFCRIQSPDYRRRSTAPQ